MPRLSTLQDQTRRRLLDLVASTATPESFGARLLTILQAAIPTDGARLLGIDPVTLLVNRTLAASANDGWARQTWLRDAYLASGPLDYIDFPQLMRANLPAVALQERQAQCWGYPPQFLAPVSADEHYRTFHETGAPVGGTLLVSLPAEEGWVGAMQLYRREPRQPFRAGDVAFLRLVAPIVGRGLRAALDRERAMTGQGDDPAEAGIIIIGVDGTLRFSTPAGEGWVARLRDAGRDQHPTLPTAVLAAMAGLRAGRASGATVVAPVPGGLVRVEASVAGTEGAAIVLTAVRPPAPPDVPSAWPLTSGEREVVGLLLHGLSNAQIAARLHRSENTVQTHLRHAYAKLGVSSRTRLLARLFREAYWPTLAAEEETEEWT